EALEDVVDERGDRAVVGRGERRERGLVVAAALDCLYDGLDDVLGPALAERSVDHARLAEQAACGAAAGHLDADAVEDRARGGDGAAGGERMIAEVADDVALDGEGRVLRVVGGPRDDGEAGLLVVHAGVERGYVEPAERGEAAKRLAPAEAL